MLSVHWTLSALTPVAALTFVALCACSSPHPPSSPGVEVGGTAAQNTIPGSAGTSGGAAGNISVIGAAAGSTATTVAVSTGSAGMAAVGGNAVGGSAGLGIAGQAGFSGNSGNGGSGGMVGAAAGTGGSAGNSPPATGCQVSPITADMRSQYPEMNDAYYTKYASVNEVIVATGSKVGDEAIVRYCRLLTEMFSNQKVRQGVLGEKMWFTMISQSEQLSSLPQISKQYGTSLDARARGLGALTPTICAEDSIMCMKGDPWVGDCICPHETGHTLYSSGILKVPELSKRLTDITNSVRSSGRLANAYVWQDGDESGMMSWGVQAWYNCAINGTNGAYHSDINTRAEIQKELPDFYQFLSELLPTDTQYKDCYSNP